MNATVRDEALRKDLIEVYHAHVHLLGTEVEDAKNCHKHILATLPESVRVNMISYGIFNTWIKGNRVVKKGFAKKNVDAITAYINIAKKETGRIEAGSEPEA